MKQGKYTEEQIVKILKEADAGIKVTDLCRKYGFSDATYYNWKNKFDGRRFRALPIIDTFTKECFWIEADTSIGGPRVTQVLSKISAIHGLPEQIVVDNGPEFISNALDAWAYERGIKLQFIRPGKPVDNCYMESFNGRFRDEFMGLYQVRKIIEDWRVDYNQARPHSSLGDLTPAEFKQKEMAKNGHNL